MRHCCVLLSGLLALPVLGCEGGDDDGGGRGGAEVSLEPSFYPGSFQLSGTVTFASPLPAGTRVQLNLAEADGFTGGALDTGNELHNDSMDSSTSQVRWRIENIGAGSFYVALSAELSGDGWIGEGDQGGYYGGTTEEPAQYQVDAAVIEVTDSLSELDFGAGPMQCKAHWGDPCTIDDDCRGASCVYDSGLRSTELGGLCTAGTCEALVATCEPFGGGAAGVVEESDCFGGP